MHELQTIYGTEDLVNFIEMLAINAHNQKLMLDAAKNKAR